MRYLLFGYDQYYPEGGMDDCFFKTDLRALAIDKAVLERGETYQFVHVYDTQTGEYVSLPEKD